MFASVDDYLDIQFRLLREDFIYTLRNGIKEYTENPFQKGGDVRVYENITILTPNFGRSGINYLVQ